MTEQTLNPNDVLARAEALRTTLSTSYRDEIVKSLYTEAEAIAKEVGIDQVHAGVLPSGKADVIRALQAAGRTVAMVGDGVNDAPALAQADLGIAIGSGSDIAKETGDVVLVSGSLHGIVEAMNSAREMFGFDRLINTLSRLDAGADAHTILATVVEAIRQHNGAAELHDDITLIVVRVLAGASGQ